MKKFLQIVSLSAMLLIPTVTQPAHASQAFCVIKENPNEITFKGKCIFQQNGSKGSFSIKSPSGLIANRLAISVNIIKSGVAEVRGLTTDGINSLWGKATRSNSDKACWVGSDFRICAY